MPELTIDPRKVREAQGQPVSQAESFSRQAEIAIAAHTVAGNEYAALCGQEIDIEAGKAEQKWAAIIRIMATPNALSAVGKMHSASSAEEIVETDPTYRDYLRHKSQTVVDKNIAYTAMQSARLSAELAIARFRAESGMR